ncbi:MAG: DUF262 domain-containing HNH endonuclease family protein [Lactobacillaceae bacterium]|jgi:uncharacterized protein with ParB-like and HNH nuclease domain|nr:DUF262 domain-containing HNH endonuclease family protein [Lactobacillaceae bacterium]
MDIRPETKPISEIFPIEGKSRYLIPAYQRPYSWESVNIEDLFNDIQQEQPHYYIGNLLVNESEDEADTFEVVDGQQRLTTISLFLVAVFQRLSEFIAKKSLDGVPATDPEIQDAISLSSNLKNKIRVGSKTRLSLLPDDQKLYENLLQVLDNNTPDKKGKYKFTKRYKTIYDLLEEMSADFSKIKQFYEKLNEVEILRITVGKVSDAYSVFTSLNAKGMPLSMIDLLKTTYLRIATNSGITEESATENWNKLLDVFRVSETDYDAALVTQFLLNNYDTFISDDSGSITKGQALEKYTEAFKKIGPKLLDEITQNAKIFTLLAPQLPVKAPEQLSVFKDLLESLTKLDATQIYPVILLTVKNYLKNDATYNRTEIQQILEYLIKFYVQRNIVLRPKASNIRARSIQFIRRMNSKDNVLSPFETLKGIFNPIVPSVKEFEDALENGVYDVSPKTVRYILIDLERDNHQNRLFNKQNPDTLDEYIKPNVPRWSIEHILPQNKDLSIEWQKSIGEVDWSVAQDENVHKIGNLTLTAYNSEMSDSNFEDKATLGEEIGVGLSTKLFLNESIPDFENNETIENKKIWSIQDIERRTKYLKGLILKKYSM